VGQQFQLHFRLQTPVLPAFSSQFSAPSIISFEELCHLNLTFSTRFEGTSLQNNCRPERELEREGYMRREREGKCTFGIPRLPGNASTQTHTCAGPQDERKQLQGCEREKVASHPLPAEREG